ncbi:hypothetical protein ONZ43_g7626 [Nemania bipapillata]|uniref:Uncharacterized protein n=1 Tax=Nemania bipapillata TaxID=110536 RepID=A0ACC2HQ07_9PEZI|nr:hypothetical protein ONZ43_g7626 [Nemania bipapillata]
MPAASSTAGHGSDNSDTAPKATSTPSPLDADADANLNASSGPDPSADTRRCFVCLVDEPETALPADWSTPCNCSLEGHQECLLAWVTDLEAQAKEVKCPVCKSPIIITERYDPAIQLSNFLNNKFSRWSPRILLGFIASSALIGSSVYGVEAISLFIGPKATVAFLMKDEAAPFFQVLRGARSEPSLNLLHCSLLPLIAPALIINRMNVGDVITLPASLVVLR